MSKHEPFDIKKGINLVIFVEMQNIIRKAAIKALQYPYLNERKEDIRHHHAEVLDIDEVVWS